MQILNKRRLLFAVCACVALATSSPAFAQHAGGHGGGYGHVGGGYGHGGYGHGGYGWHGCYVWHGGYCRGGYWYGGYWGPWGCGWVFPYYYPAYWWGGVPYYYDNPYYYTWNDAAGEYQTVTPPAEVLRQAQ